MTEVGAALPASTAEGKCRRTSYDGYELTPMSALLGVSAEEMTSAVGWPTPGVDERARPSGLECATPRAFTGMLSAPGRRSPSCRSQEPQVGQAFANPSASPNRACVVGPAPLYLPESQHGVARSGTSFGQGCARSPGTAPASCRVGCNGGEASFARAPPLQRPALRATA